MKKITLMILVSMISFQSIAAEIKTISVYVTHEQLNSVVGCDKNCSVFDIDETSAILSDFFGELPSDQDEAYTIVQEKLQSPQWHEYEQQVVLSQKMIITAFQLGVKKYPAIVINDDSVSYGTTDVNKAIDDYHQAQRKGG